MRDPVKKGCSEDLLSFQDCRGGGMVQLECFSAAQVGRRMEKTTGTGTSWRTGEDPGDGLSSVKYSISEKLTTLSRRPGVRPSRCSRMKGQQRRWRCFPRIARLRSMMDMLSRFG